MGHFKQKDIEERQTKHNWTKETMGECAEIHMEQLVWYQCLANPEDRLAKFEQIISGYEKVLNNLPKEDNSG